MVRKPLLLHLLFLAFCFSVFSQSSGFIQIETNNTLCILSFLETANNARGVSSSFQGFIEQELGNNKNFQDLVKRYSHIKLNGQFTRNEYPEARFNNRDIMDLLWIASSYAKNIDDFSERIIGMLPNHSHQELIDVMKAVEPVYEVLVWEKELDQIRRMETQLVLYVDQIEELFMKVSGFYGTNWSKKIPFKIMLYPIPLAHGNTTAIPKGNALICSFLSRNEQDYEGRLGVIVHEMCHILFDEQPLELQHQIDTWFEESPSEWSKLAYSYLDEGLATAIGNGWAYQQLHGELDTTQWYNNPYIDGFAHALFDPVSQYLSSEKGIDQAFIQKAIAGFEKEFPQAIREVDILMNEIILLANSEDEEGVEFISKEMRRNFNIRSQWFSTPVKAPNSLQLLGKKQVTKFFLVEKDHEATLSLIKSYFPDMKAGLSPSKSFLYSFRDAQTQSAVILLNLGSLDELAKGLQAMKEVQYLNFGKVIKL
jgi:hypothetical protein